VKRLNLTETLEALAALEEADVPARVDALADAYLVGFGPTRAAMMRRELARAFLTAAPFTELSYRIWQRLGLDDEDSYSKAYGELRRPSQRKQDGANRPIDRIAPAGGKQSYSIQFEILPRQGSSDAPTK
jgi:hypothetical protein